MPSPFDLRTITAKRRKVFLAFVDRVFEEMKKDGTKPVNLRSLITPRSQVVTGMRLSVEAFEDTQDRIIEKFAKEYPLIADSNAISTKVDTNE